MNLVMKTEKAKEIQMQSTLELNDKIWVQIGARNEFVISSPQITFSHFN